MEEPGINYYAIFTDIIEIKFSDKKSELMNLLEKRSLSVIDIIHLNQRIFGLNQENQKYRSYGKSDILQILDYQKRHRLNNSQLAGHFKLSRNTVAKWKKMFLMIFCGVAIII